MIVGDDWKDPLANTHLIISNNFDFSVLEDTNTGVGGSKIDTDSGGFRHFELIWKLTLLSNLYLYWHFWYALDNQHLYICVNLLTKLLIFHGSFKAMKYLLYGHWN